jgi:hypothetical protein
LPPPTTISSRDPFVGYVLRSKIHVCIESGKRIPFVGSPASDVHYFAAASLAAGQYRRVDVGDVEGAVVALKRLEGDVAMDRKEVSIGEPKSGPHGESVIEARPARANAIR